MRRGMGKPAAVVKTLRVVEIRETIPSSPMVSNPNAEHQVLQRQEHPQALDAHCAHLREQLAVREEVRDAYLVIFVETGIVEMKIMQDVRWWRTKYQIKASQLGIRAILAQDACGWDFKRAMSEWLLLSDCCFRSSKSPRGALTVHNLGASSVARSCHFGLVHAALRHCGLVQPRCTSLGCLQAKDRLYLGFQTRLALLTLWFEILGHLELVAW